MCLSVDSPPAGFVTWGWVQPAQQAPSACRPLHRLMIPRLAASMPAVHESRGLLPAQCIPSVHVRRWTMAIHQYGQTHESSFYGRV